MERDRGLLHPVRSLRSARAACARAGERASALWTKFLSKIWTKFCPSASLAGQTPAMQGDLHPHARASDTRHQPRSGAGGRAQAASGRTERPPSRSLFDVARCFFLSTPGGGAIARDARPGRTDHEMACPPHGPHITMCATRPRAEGRAGGRQAATRGRARGARHHRVGCRLSANWERGRLCLDLPPGPAPHPIPRPRPAALLQKEALMSTYSANHSVERECGEEGRKVEGGGKKV